MIDLIWELVYNFNTEELMAYNYNQYISYIKSITYIDTRRYYAVEYR